jgi:hypothetical protein
VFGALPVCRGDPSGNRSQRAPYLVMGRPAREYGSRYGLPCRLQPGTAGLPPEAAVAVVGRGFRDGPETDSCAVTGRGADRAHIMR